MRIAHIVSPAVIAAAALNLASTASAETVAVRIVPPFELARYADRGAVGLLVPGSGATVSREGALAALRTGKTRPAKLGGLPTGRDRIGDALGRRSGDVTVFVSLPPPGRHANDRRYPVAVVGGGYHGLLTSTRTHVDGLVSVADVAPTVEALECSSGCPRPSLRSREDADAVADLRALDRRFEELHGARLSAGIVVFTAMLSLAAFGLVLRSRLLARAALAAPALVLAAALALSALGESGSWVTAVVLSAAAAAALPAALLPLGPLFAGLLAAFAITLRRWPEVPALAALGPHPEGGGRFYGLTNSVETLLLLPALVAGAALGPLWAGLLAIATAAAGVDGGGLVVFFAAFVALALLTRRRGEALALALLAAVGALVLAVAGSNHVADAISGGPGEIAHDLLRRWHLSWASITSSPLTLVLFLACLSCLVALARSRPRSPLLDALLLALAVSLLFNDAPNDVVRFGAASAATLWAWQRVTRRASEAGR
jgi:hypothetical protein